MCWPHTHRRRLVTTVRGDWVVSLLIFSISCPERQDERRGRERVSFGINGSQSGPREGRDVFSADARLCIRHSITRGSWASSKKTRRANARLVIPVLQRVFRGSIPVTRTFFWKSVNRPDTCWPASIDPASSIVISQHVVSADNTLIISSPSWISHVFTRRNNCFVRYRFEPVDPIRMTAMLLSVYVIGFKGQLVLP